ncbi:MAG: hypothetical protein HGA52_03735 [Bacteroidales bacterium]|nr:hypothetical protein [Bacteroidales bacterium]
MFFKKTFQKRALAKLDTKRDVVFMPVNNAKKVTIIYGLEEEGIGEAVDFLTSFLEEKKIAYEGIAINLGKNITDPASLKEGITLVDKKSVNNYGLPLSEIKIPFGGECSDLLFDFAAGYNFTHDYIVKICSSRFKTGRSNYDNNPFDFVAGSVAGTPLNFVKHAINYLTSIKPA